MNWKSCLALTGGILVAVLPAFAQPQGTELPGGPRIISAGHALPGRMACGQGIAAKVVRSADLWTSTDGTNWVKRRSGIEFALHDIAYGNGLFVAVGNEGAIVTSADGVSWTVRDSRTDERMRGIAYASGIFVAVGYSGTILTSRNGVHWTSRNSGATQRLQRIAFGQGKFAADARRLKLQKVQPSIRASRPRLPPLSYFCTTPLPTNGVGNITNIPLFVDFASGNLRLQPNSPCINAGLNLFAPSGPDLDGNPRIVGGDVDMGANEYQSLDLLSFGLVSNQFGFNITGQSNWVIVLETSSDFTNWIPLTTNTLSGSPFPFSDSALPNLPQRFYRARQW